MRKNTMLAREFYKQFCEDDIELVKNYLSKRYGRKRELKVFGVVYDILHQCDIACIGCGTNAIPHGQELILNPEPSLQQILTVFEKIQRYSELINVPVFINIGGGEPFLRSDIIEVLKNAAKIFGVSSVGVDTNGTLEDAFPRIIEAMNHASYVGISINGLEQYHNWWAGNRKINPYERSMGTLSQICNCGDDYIDKLEITSVATNRNLNDIPELIRILAHMGVRHYSVHRAMPVGRMSRHPELLPTAGEYFSLMINIIKVAEETGIDVHIHHSIESIHETLLLGLSTYAEDKAGNPDMGSSLGIEPEGCLVFDPWCTSGMWKLLSSGCIYDTDLEFADLLTGKGSVFDITKTYTAPHLRCSGCKYPCSGGSRIVAAATNLLGISERDALLTDLLSAMTSVDPACPLYKEEKDDDEV